MPDYKKVVGEKKLKTYIVNILDRSGSMGRIRDLTISTYNENVQNIKNNIGDTEVLVSLVLFNNSVEPKLWNKSINELKEITREDYIPNDWTRLNDAIGYSIDRLLAEAEDINDENVSVLMCITTDGEENKSKEYSREHIKEKIQKLQETGRWTFTYMGVKTGAIREVSDIVNLYSICTGNVNLFENNVENFRHGYDFRNIRTVNYMSSRAGGMSCTNNFFSPEALNDDRPNYKKVK